MRHHIQWPFIWNGHLLRFEVKQMAAMHFMSLNGALQ